MFMVLSSWPIVTTRVHPVHLDECRSARRAAADFVVSETKGITVVLTNQQTTTSTHYFGNKCLKQLLVPRTNVHRGWNRTPVRKKHQYIYSKKRFYNNFFLILLFLCVTRLCRRFFADFIRFYLYKHYWA